MRRLVVVAAAALPVWVWSAGVLVAPLHPPSRRAAATTQRMAPMIAPTRGERETIQVRSRVPAGSFRNDKFGAVGSRADGLR